MAATRKLSQSDLLSLFVVDGVQDEQGLEAYLLGVLERCTQWFRTSGASIFLESEDAGIYRLKAKFGPAAKLPEGAVIQKGKGLAGATLLNGEPRIIVRDADALRKDIGSSMIVPLQGAERGKFVGVLNLARSHSEPEFDAEDLQFAEAIAHQIALAIRNARLLADARHLSETLRVVLANLGFGLISIAPNGSVSHFNPEMVMLLGAVPGRGEAWATYLDRCQEEFREALCHASEEALHQRRHRSRRAVNQRTYNISATPLPSQGCTVTLQDVTELENAQREYDRLRRMAEVGQMTATIAHEIRNPLTGVRSAAKMIQDTPELAEEFAQIIENEAIKLSLLCDEFLEFARPLRLERHPVNLTELCHQVAKLMEGDFRASEVELKLEFAPEAGSLKIDSRRLEQVVRNLLLNALQATPKGGTVTLEVKADLLAVTDTGCGMDDEAAGRLFSPFFTTKPKGTGLGLSMVRKIVDAHEAKIGVWSKPGVGTRFEIRFNQEHTI